MNTCLGQQLVPCWLDLRLDHRLTIPFKLVSVMPLGSLPLPRFTCLSISFQGKSLTLTPYYFSDSIFLCCMSHLPILPHLIGQSDFYWQVMLPFSPTRWGDKVIRKLLCQGCLHIRNLRCLECVLIIIIVIALPISVIISHSRSPGNAKLKWKQQQTNPLTL